MATTKQSPSKDTAPKSKPKLPPTGAGAGGPVAGGAPKAGANNSAAPADPKLKRHEVEKAINKNLPGYEPGAAALANSWDNKYTTTELADRVADPKALKAQVLNAWGAGGKKSARSFVRAYAQPDKIAVQKLADVDTASPADFEGGKVAEFRQGFYEAVAGAIKSAQPDRGSTYSVMQTAAQPFRAKGKKIDGALLGKFAQRAQGLGGVYDYGVRGDVKDALKRKLAPQAFGFGTWAKLNEQMSAAGMAESEILQHPKAKAAARKAWKTKVNGNGAGLLADVSPAAKLSLSHTWFTPDKVKVAAGEAGFTEIMTVFALQPEWFPEGTATLKIQTDKAGGISDARKPTAFDGMQSALWVSRAGKAQTFGVTGGGVREYLAKDVKYSSVVSATVQGLSESFEAELAALGAMFKHKLVTKPDGSTEKVKAGPGDRTTATEEMLRGNELKPAGETLSGAAKSAYGSVGSAVKREQNTPSTVKGQPTPTKSAAAAGGFSTPQPAAGAPTVRPSKKKPVIDTAAPPAPATSTAKPPKDDKPAPPSGGASSTTTPPPKAATPPPPPPAPPVAVQPPPPVPTLPPAPPAQVAPTPIAASPKAATPTTPESKPKTPAEKATPAAADAKKDDDNDTSGDAAPASADSADKQQTPAAPDPQAEAAAAEEARKSDLLTGMKGVVPTLVSGWAQGKVMSAWESQEIANKELKATSDSAFKFNAPEALQSAPQQAIDYTTSPAKYEQYYNDYFKAHPKSDQNSKGFGAWLLHKQSTGERNSTLTKMGNVVAPKLKAQAMAGADMGNAKVSQMVSAISFGLSDGVYGGFNLPGPTDREHDQFKPASLQEERGSGATRISYTTNDGRQSFRALVNNDTGMQMSIVGNNLSLKGSEDMQSRGVTQDSGRLTTNMDMDRSHLIADQFKGSGYKNSSNLITASAHFNREVMSAVEDRIKGSIVRFGQANPDATIRFSMGVQVFWGEVVAQSVIQQIVNSPWFQENYPHWKQSEIEAHLSAKFAEYGQAKLKRCMNVQYAVVPIAKKSDGSEVRGDPLSFKSGPDLWMFLNS